MSVITAENGRFYEETMFCRNCVLCGDFLVNKINLKKYKS